jgi:hypothetical protein
MTAYDDHIVIALRRSAQNLVKQTITDLETVLGQIVASAVQTVPGAWGGGITRFDKAVVGTGHATSEDIRRLDQLQCELGQGPCVTAVDHPTASGVVLAHDLASRPDLDRWPRFAPTAVREGYPSSMSVQVPTRSRDHRAALNLYSREAHTFTEQACLVAGLFATQASLVLYGAERAAGYEQALDTRDVIGRAKGILIERFKIDDDQAFEMLITSSQETNLKLVDVARWLARESSPGRSLVDAAATDVEVGPPELRIV